jgi:hypothetical protein
MLHRYGKRSRLGEVLIKTGRITQKELDAAPRASTRQPAGDRAKLIRLRVITEDDDRDALCKLRINFSNLDPIAIDRSVAKLISQRYAARYHIVPLLHVRILSSSRWTIRPRPN